MSEKTKNTIYFMSQQLDKEEAEGKFRIKGWDAKVDAYEYCIRNGVLEVYFGTVTQGYDRIHSLFHWFNKDKACDDRAVVAQIEGRIYKGILWLRKRNDELAKKLFIKWYNEKCVVLKEQLEKYQQDLILIHTTKWTEK